MSRVLKWSINPIPTQTSSIVALQNCDNIIMKGFLPWSFQNKQLTNKMKLSVIVLSQCLSGETK
jgi:hypothetical protein